MSAGAEVKVYTRMRMRIFVAVGAIPFVAYAVIGLTYLRGYTPLFLCVGALALAAWMCFRATRMATIVVREDGIEARTYIYTQRLSWTQIEAFEAPPESSPWGRRSGTSVGIRKATGELLTFKEFWSPYPEPRPGSPIDEQLPPNECQQIATELNDYLRRAKAGEALG